MDSSRALTVLGLAGLAGVGAVIYLFLRKDDENFDDTGVRTSRRTVIKVKVPNECIGTVIGRGGCTVKAIQEKTGARVNCNDESATDNYRIVTIQGDPKAAQQAEYMIHEIIMNQPLVISHEMWVPSRACGRIIGKGGESIRAMSRTSCAKILVDSTGDEERGQTRVLLKGTAEQVALAQALITEKVEQEVDFHHRVEMAVANRSPRREPKDNFNYMIAASNDQDNQTQSPYKTEKLDAAGSDGFFEVFVSAYVHPGQFWVQLISQRGVELDQLVDEMTEYYEKPESKELHALKEISIGQLVAAPFDHDKKWYRAEVIEIEENEYDPAESNVTLYYGDYGDSCVVKRKNLHDLRTDYLTLHFQAIECTLAHVKPQGQEWSNEASDYFEELAHVALWQKKLVHVVTYKDSDKKRGQRAGSPIPVVEVHDMEKKINIGEELVKKGFAVWESASEDVDGLQTNGAEVSLPSPSTFHKEEASSSQKPSVNSTQKYNQDISSKTISKPESDSLAFLNKVKEQVVTEGFTPKTLDPPKKRQQKEKKSVIVPEHLSSSEDEFDLQ